MGVSKKQQEALEEKLGSLGYSIRVAKGVFSSNACVVKNSKLILVNKMLSPDSRYNLLKEIFDTLDR
jgi:hypothetical protein